MVQMFDFFKPQNYRKPEEAYVMGVLICLKKPMSPLWAAETVIAENLFAFEPATMAIQTDAIYTAEKALTQLRAEGDNTTGVFWSLSEDSSLTICSQAISDSAVCLFWKFNNPENYYQVILNIIHRFSEEPLFMSAFVYDYYDSFWQSATIESDYHISDRKTNWLRFIKDEYDETVINVSKNYGRRFVLSHTNVIAGSTIWMSPFFLEKFNAKAKIMQMESVELLDSGVFRLDLYKPGEFPDRKKQKNYLDLLGLI